MSSENEQPDHTGPVQQPEFDANMAYDDSGARDASEAARQPSADEVVEMISEVEQRLAGLRQAHAERQAQSEKLGDLRAQLDEREDDLRRREDELRSGHADLEQSRHELQRLQSEERERAEAAAAELSAELEQRENQISDDRGELEAQVAAFEEARAAFQQDRAELDTQWQELDGSRSELEERWSQFNADREQLDNERAEASRQNDELAGRREELDRAFGELDQQRSAVDEQRQAVEQERSAVNEAREELDRARGALDTDRAASELKDSQLETERERLAEAEKALQLRTESLGVHESKLEERIDFALEALAVAGKEQSELASKLAETEDRLQEAEQAQGPLEEALEEARHRVSELENEVNNLRESMNESGGEAEARVAQLSEELDEARRRAEELEGAVRELHSQLEDAKSAAPSDTAGDGTPSEVLAEYDAEIERLEAALQQAEARAADAEQNGGGAAGGDACDQLFTDEDIEFLRLRRDRLSRARTHVKEQSRKVRRAGEMLKTRYQQCEEVLGQRVELVAVRDALVAAQAKIEKRNSSLTAVKQLATVVLIIAVLAGVSWTATLQAFPGTYAVETTVSAKAKGREATPEEMADWQAFHLEMVKDPRFLDDAAERLRRRGIASMGDAASLKMRMDQDMDISSTADGHMTFELRGTGKSRTERELATFINAFQTSSNALRARRGDPTIAQVSDGPNVTTDPINFQHLASAGTIFGGLLTLAIFGGLFIWKSLAKSKSKFEQQEEVDAVLAEARWEDPRAAA